MAGDYYALLGVASGASAAEVHAAYRRLAKRVHPDVSGDSGLFIRVRTARDVLADPVRRARYDASRRAAPVPNRPDATDPVDDRASPAEDFATWEPWRPDRAAEDRDFDDEPAREPVVDRSSYPVGEAVRRAYPVAHRIGAVLVACAQALPLRTVRGCVLVVLLWLVGPLVIRLVSSSSGPTGAAVGGFLASVLNLTLVALLVVRAVTLWQHRRTRGERAT